ncbi:MAG: HEAT repeat domain-containing protein [Phycisphaerales bacterium]|nr:HEAT repeat domain-containing protein [Phycisphaerales bacterium]
MAHDRRTAARWVRAVAFSCGLLAAAPSALAQASGDEADALRDFIHYTRINNTELASAMAEQILDSGLDATDFVSLVEDSGELARFEETISRATSVAGLEGPASRLAKLYNDGKLRRARLPEEVAKNLDLLKGNARGRLIGRQRLAEAGEYAMPQMLPALLQQGDPELAAVTQQVMVEMGQQSVTPLCAALAKLDPARQELVANVLGLLGQRAALPYLSDVMAKTSSDAVRSACARSIDRLGGDARVPAAVLFVALGEDYYHERAELTSFPGEEYQLLWSYDPGVGLVQTPIATPVFHEAMSMRVTEAALERGATDPGAVALWVASNFHREIQTPEGYENPAYPAGKRDAEYFGVAAGSDVGQRVLARAIDDRDTTLARRAIGVIERTAGGGSLWSKSEGRAPLLESLEYPNRRVQFEAALALAASRPDSSFDGSERVVPLLASAIKDASRRYAIVLAADREQYQATRATLESLAYQVLPYGQKLSDVEEALVEVGGVDLVALVGLAADQTRDTIAEVRSSYRLAPTPVMALLSQQGYSALRANFERDASVAVRPSGLSEQQVRDAIAQLVDTASGGPITADEAAGFADRSLSAMRDLAVSGSGVFNVADATLPLIAALGEKTGPTKLRVAEVLSHVGEQRAQVAVMDAALGSAGAERVALLDEVARSAKRFGNQLADRQVRRLIELARDGAGEEATAAAALMGALELPNESLLPLILGGQGLAQAAR